MKKGLFVAAIMLTGCVQTEWVKDNYKTQERDKDLAACEYEAKKATAASMDLGAGWDRAVLAQDCMKLKGYNLQQIKPSS